MGLFSATADCTANEEAVQRMTLDRSDWPAVVSTSTVLANDTVRQILNSVHDEEMIRIKIRHFADSGAAFNVNVLPVIEGDVRLDRRQFKSVLPEQVSSVISDYIGANATRVGVWEPRIVTANRGQGVNVSSSVEAGGASSGLGHIGWVLGAMGVGAGIVALMLLR